MNIFYIGIGGIGMSAVAQILLKQGNTVSGSDSSASEITKHLQQKGIPVTHLHESSNISDNIERVIYSEAVPESNPERQRAQELGIEQMSYAQALGEISKKQKTIAITGTHGKTTVTGMLTSVLLSAQLDPTIVIGSKINLLENQNFRVGKDDLFLTEACEYRNNFHYLSPHIVLINNLEPDHLDFFKHAENYFESFQILIEKIPEEGHLILFEEDKDKLDLSKVIGKIHLISLEQCRKEIYSLKVPGKHNQQNAYAAEAVAKILRIKPEQIRHGLEQFIGTWRRFEFKGEVNGAKVYDDYGHHPTEVQATLQGAREWHPDKKLVVVFQPHQYSRTREFFDQFSHSFKDANEAWITDIYQARDSQEDLEATSAQALADAITETTAAYVPVGELAARMKNEGDPNTVFVVMGAGSIHNLFEDIEFDK